MPGPVVMPKSTTSLLDNAVIEAVARGAVCNWLQALRGDHDGQRSGEGICKGCLEELVDARLFKASRCL